MAECSSTKSIIIMWIKAKRVRTSIRFVLVFACLPNGGHLLISCVVTRTGSVRVGGQTAVQDWKTLSPSPPLPHSMQHYRTSPKRESSAFLLAPPPPLIIPRCSLLGHNTSPRRLRNHIDSSAGHRRLWDHSHSSGGRRMWDHLHSSVRPRKLQDHLHSSVGPRRLQDDSHSSVGPRRLRDYSHSPASPRRPWGLFTQFSRSQEAAGPFT